MAIENGLAYTYTNRSTKQKLTEQRIQKEGKGTCYLRGKIVQFDIFVLTTQTVHFW